MLLLTVFNRNEKPQSETWKYERVKFRHPSTRRTTRGCARVYFPMDFEYPPTEPTSGTAVYKTSERERCSRT